MLATYPGSFDPVTNGHLDIIGRAAKLCDRLIVAVLDNPSKSAMFTAQERIDMLNEVCKDMANVEIIAFGGLLIDFVKEQNADAVIRGVRSVLDFDFEMQMAALNKAMENSVETLFMPADSGLAFISSSAVKEIAVFGGNIRTMVPPTVFKKMFEKIDKL
jgi:pantetheine-phosphate adenylyltransferase